MKLNLEKLHKKNICLIGLMGSGKSVVGRLLSKKLGLKYYDSDTLIEKSTNKTINQIFLNYGENHFRKIEEEIILPILDRKNCVIALGGGSILSLSTRNALKINSFAIYLKVNNNILYERLKNSKKRPLIFNQNIREKLIHLSRDREKYYRKANLIVNNSTDTEETLKIIINNLKEGYAQEN